MSYLKERHYMPMPKSKTCNICGERMFGGRDVYIAHGEHHHPDYYLSSERILNFVKKNFWCPLDERWYGYLTWMSRTIAKHGWTNEQYYLAYGEQYLPETWQRNISDPVLGDGRNHNKCMQCDKETKFHSTQWQYAAFCGFKCSTTWYAMNTDRVSRAQETIIKRSAEDSSFLLRPTQHAYWTTKGFSDEEATQKVKERQRTNSLEAFIQRAGGDKELGTQRHADRQEKWLKSMHASGMFSGISMVSRELFSKIADIVPTIKYGTNEVVVHLGHRSCKVDCVDRKNNRVIEFYGDFWHGNPKKYHADDLVGQYLIASDKWDRDAKRIQALTEAGFETLVIWEQDYRTNPDAVVAQCVDFLNTGHACVPDPCHQGTALVD